MAVLASFARVCVPDLELALSALAVSGVDDVRLRFGHPAGLQLAVVGEILVLAGPDEVIAPFRETDVTLIVDNVDEALDAALTAGADLVRGVAQQAVGRNATVAFSAGPVVEYVEWDDETRTAAGIE